MPSSLEAFVLRAPVGVAEGLTEEAFGEVLARARAAHPDAGVDDVTFAAYLADRISGDSVVALDSVAAADLYLACACSQGEPAALATFERVYMPDLRAAIASVDSAGSHRDEVAQLLRERLFVATSEELPKIAHYSGSGALYSWLRVIAVRLTLNELRRHRREVSVPDDTIPEEAIGDVEAALFKGKYQRDFKQAFEAAIAELEARDRTVLRLHLVDKLTIDDIGATYKVHRTSAARWLRQVRSKLAERTRDLLQARLEVADTELESIMRLVRSRLELSVTRVLEQAEP